MASAVPLSEVVLRSDALGSHGAVASESIECSTIGRDLLARGGNAMDALVGTTFCVGVIAGYHAGIGGGGFALVRDSNGVVEAIDFREAAPQAATEDMFRGNVNGSIFDGLAVGVPGELRGLEYIHTKYGVLPWKIVMQGAIHLAYHGFRVSTDTVRYMTLAMKEARSTFLINDANFAKDFAPNGTLLGVGDVMTRRRYAKSLQKISDRGVNAFYSGAWGQSLVKFIQSRNGTMTLDDLQSYAVKSRSVKSVTYRGFDLYGIGSPASGAVCLVILKILEQFAPTEKNDTNLTAHRFIEAMRFGFGARLRLGDPDYVADIEKMEEKILEEGTAKHIRRHILDDKTQPVHAYDPRHIYAPDDHGTSHIVTADDSGMAASLTTTINLLFGSRIVEPSSGVILNNEMNDFSIPGVPNEFGFEPSEANFIRPGKRPLSSTTPIIATFPNGTLFAVVGAAGGSRIISATATALWHMVEHGLTIREALREPRMHDQLMPNTVLLEYKFDNDIAAALVERQHNVTWVPEGLSAVHGIRMLPGGIFEAAGEPRQGNSAGFAF